MLANLITLGRAALLFVMVPLLYDEGLWPKVLALVAVLFVIYMDALDGQPQSRTRWAGGVVHFHQLNIGYVRSNGFHFDGDLDDLEIRGRALSPISSKD